MITSWAFFCSTNLVTVLQPARKVFGFLEGASSLPATLASAFAFKRVCFWSLVSGRYFSKILNSWTAKSKEYYWGYDCLHFFFRELTSLLVQSLRELVDWWWNLQALLQDCLVTLDANVLGPSHETGQVTFWLNILSCGRKSKKIFFNVDFSTGSQN